MGLLLARTINSAETSNRSLEHMGHQFVLVTINMSAFLTDTTHLLPRPYHWRLADGKNPPLDVSIDSQSGLIREITVFLADKKFEQNVSQSRCRSSKGHPVFETTSWTEDEYYIDEEGVVGVTLYNNDVYCSFSGLNVDNCLDIDDKLRCLFTSENVLEGFVFKDLDQQEMKVLKDAGLI